MAGIFAHGSKIEIDGVKIGGMLDIDIPEQDREDVETTDHDSAFRREYVPGLIDVDRLTLTMRLVPGDYGQQALRDNAEADEEIEEFVITMPSHANPQLTWTFNAYVASTGGTLFWEGEAAQMTATLKITGDITVGEAA